MMTSGQCNDFNESQSQTLLLDNQCNLIIKISKLLLAVSRYWIDKILTLTDLLVNLDAVTEADELC